MEQKLKDLVGQPNVWLFLKSSGGWFKDVHILDVSAEVVTFRYEHESNDEKRLWEKTTRLENVAEVEVKLLAMPKDGKQVSQLKDQLSQLLEQDRQ
ncbi:DUF6679 family protein [Almyronema epifaneia]|uniref:DUF6679 family protein n=1 Tax=Almyronema epifaneia S1 TaxID=2991925 RepID=A0ABW6II49_9CYAN